MESLAVIIMEKNKENGFFENEVGSYTISNNANLIDNIYMMKENEKEIIHLKLTVDRDVDDWEFSAILEYYDDEVLKEEILSCEEVDDTYNPTWEVTFEFIDSQYEMQSKLQSILDKHKKELDEVYEAIKEAKEEEK